MRFLIVSIVCLLLAACQEDLATNPTTSSDAPALEMTALVSRSAFAAVPQQCPLSIYQTRQNINGPVANCDQNPAACLAQCEQGNASACFDAARTIEKGNLANDSDRTYPLFMASCALGSGNACVNAGATVKNGQWSGARPAAAQTAQCQFQTYDRMCNDGHAWGCYMVAGEYLRDDGFRPRNEAQFETKMRRACQIDTTSGACEERFK